MRPERIWRAFGVGLFLAVIGLGGSGLALTVFPLIALATRDPVVRQRRIQWVLHQSFRLYCAAIDAFKVADVEMTGAERLGQLSGVLIVANHPSLLDVVMIMAAVPRVQCVVKGGLWKNPFFRLTVEGAGYIRNDLPPEELVAACVATLKAGNNLIIFPEGTRTVRGRPVKPQRGFANVATLAEADVQLVRLACEPPILHKGNPWWRVPPSRTRFSLEVAERLDIRDYLAAPSRPLAARRLASRFERHILESTPHGPIGIGDQGADRDLLEPGRSVA